jgi:hypothetical protein
MVLNAYGMLCARVLTGIENHASYQPNGSEGLNQSLKMYVTNQAGYTAGGDTKGSQTVNVDPLPRELLTVIRPE